MVVYESQRTFEVNLAIEDAGPAKDFPSAPDRPTLAEVVFHAERLNESGTILGESDLATLRDYLANGITTALSEIFAPPLTEERIARGPEAWAARRHVDRGVHR